MSMRPEVLHWKTGDHPGIRTAAGAVVEWPGDAPFAQPDQATHDAWAVEYDAAVPDIEAARDIDNLLALRAVVRWVAPLVGKTPAQARQEIIDIYKSIR